MLSVLAVYVALLPWTGQVWTRTGDEPHYLVAADSLARGDGFDLRHSYNPAVYLDWYPSPNLNPQVQTRPDGAEYLIHTYGLPLLIAPAYWLAGARGVAYFMALIGALLAGQVYLLALQVTHHWRASALSALVIAFAPPVVWYVYLLYPELAGALCVTVAARLLLDIGNVSKSASGDERSSSPDALLGLSQNVLLGLCLAALPWLSARFIPGALVLAALAVWRVVTQESKDDVATNGRWSLRPYAADILRRAGRIVSLSPTLLLLALGLGSLAWFNAAHYGSSAVTASYTVDSSLGPVSWPMLFQFVRGIFGWLIDHQRGLLVAAPIYFVAFIGLGQWLWRREWDAAVVALPFAAVLASTALVGGYWIGVEPAARYLVYVLPPLGAGLAYGWVHRRGPWLAGLTVLTLAFSLWTAMQVFREPLLGQTGDLIGEQLPALVPFLPAVGKPAFVTPGSPGSLAGAVALAADPPGEPVLWRVPPGQAGAALQAPAMTDLPFGWYTLQFSLGVNGAAPAQAPVARVLFQSGDGRSLVDTMLYGRDFSPDGQPRAFSFPLFNNVYDQWEQPAGLWIFTTGRAELLLSRVALPPDTFHSLVVPALWLAGLALLGVLVGLRFRAEAPQPTGPGWLSGWPAMVAGVVLVAGVGAWSLRPLARTYAVADLANYIGTRVADPAAAGGLALSTSGDESTPGALASSRPESWPAGRYRWTLSLKASGPSPAGSSPASLTILAPRQAVPGFPAQLVAGAVPADGQFHTLQVEFDNPLRQALVFELDVSGATALETQGFEVRPVP